jgi:hypothetical protein
MFYGVDKPSLSLGTFAGLLLATWPHGMGLLSNSQRRIKGNDSVPLEIPVFKSWSLGLLEDLRLGDVEPCESEFNGDCMIKSESGRTVLDLYLLEWANFSRLWFKMLLYTILFGFSFATSLPALDTAIAADLLAKRQLDNSLNQISALVSGKTNATTYKAVLSVLNQVKPGTAPTTISGECPCLCSRLETVPNCSTNLR